MKLGFVSAILPDLETSEVMTFARETGFDCVELMCWPHGKAERRYAGVTHLDVSDMSDARGSEVRAQWAASHVAVSGLGYYPNVLSPEAEEASATLEHLKKVIRAARRVGVPVVNTFIGRDWRRSVDDNWPRFLEVWRPLVALAEEEGVKLGIENCPMLFTQDEWPGGKNLAATPAIWRRMFEAIPSSHFGLNFDPSHLVWQRIDYLRAVREFAERIVHVHAKDARVDPHRLDEVGILATPLAFHSPKLPGFGEVEWGRFISVLGDTGYRGPVCVEVEDRAFEDDLAGRKAALQLSHRYLRQFVV